MLHKIRANPTGFYYYKNEQSILINALELHNSILLWLLEGCNYSVGVISSCKMCVIVSEL